MRKQYAEYYKKLGLNIAYYRKEAGLTQQQLSDGLEIEQAHLSKIERAKVGISLDLLFAISEVLAAPIHKLMEFRD